MNYIVCSLLYHAEEYIVFWIFVIIIEKLQMKDIYMPSKFLFHYKEVKKNSDLY